MSKEPLKFYITVLKSDGCVCGRYKRENLALCFKCYNRLPKDIQIGLWKKLGNGFEENYEQAVKYLKDL